MPVDHYENFPVASRVLPRHLREPVAAIYAFARSADDIADEGTASDDERLRRLDAYGRELGRIAAGERSDDPLFQRLAATIAAHQLPLAPFSDLLDAFRQDVKKKRYADYAELRDYCRRSANPIGRLLLSLFRADTAENIARSDAICSALQLVNHWQDVGLDLQRGRIYLPQEDMVRFGVAEQSLGDTADRRFCALLAFEVERARALMREGAPLGRSLRGRLGLELRLIMAGGLRILERIEAANYDVCRRRPVLTAVDWPLLLFRALIPS